MPARKEKVVAEGKNEERQAIPGQAKHLYRTMAEEKSVGSVYEQIPEGKS